MDIMSGSMLHANVTINEHIENKDKTQAEGADIDVEQSVL